MHATKENLKTISRLGPQAAFDILRKSKDKRWVSEGMSVQALPRLKPTENTQYGLCISASKKTAKRAHDRNRMKRRLKAVASEILPRYAKAELDYMISARHGTMDRDFDLLKKDLLWCLKKLELMKDK